MSFHPNEVIRRSRVASVLVAGVLIFLLTGFFRTQIMDHEQYSLRSEENRLQSIPMPAPRGIIYDRNGAPIAENVVGYSISVMATRADTLRGVLQRLGTIIPITEGQVEAAIRRFQRDGPSRPAVLLPDASYDVVAVLEERRSEFPGLIIQSAPKRSYPDGSALSAFVGYIAEINESELARPAFRDSGYKAGMLIGKQGLEKQYESMLRGREGSRFVEVDARGRIVREAGVARADLQPLAGKHLQTTIDLPLQRFVDTLFTRDGIIAGAVAMDPMTGDVLALHSTPGYDPNRFVGGIPAGYWKELREDPKQPLYNKALQGLYPPASTWKLLTAAVGLEEKVVGLTDRMPVSCSGGFTYGRYFRCWDKNGHGALDLSGAIAKSCNVYFYQLGLKLNMNRLLAGGVKMGMNRKTGIDLPEEKKPRWPDSEAYFDKRFGKGGWTRTLVLNQAIGQGDNDQTILSMARFYTAFASKDGYAVEPRLVSNGKEVTREQLLHLTPAQTAAVREALTEVLTERGTANSARLPDVVAAGKTGTAQNTRSDLAHAWFVGFAPAHDPKIVVAVMVEFGDHGYTAARYATAIMAKYLNVRPPVIMQNLPPIVAGPRTTRDTTAPRPAAD
ncbi:MAG: penicillin-binding protein 2 [Gemmatimonadaceae bacterium]|nr:penicillin-binding protein 2 [Gemmatimonadaceae bacterium]